MKQITPFILLGALAALTACKDDESTTTTPVEPDNKYVGQAVGNFSADEWYPGGELGTTLDVSSTAYQNETPATDQLTNGAQLFKFGEKFFESEFNTSKRPFNGLGPAWVRSACITCHPAYGHGKRQTRYRANDYGNGYLLVIYHPTAGTDANGNAYLADTYVTEVTGMPQTKAAHPFLPPVDEEKIDIKWHTVTAMESGLPLKFKDGEEYELIYPEVTIPQEAFNTDPKPENYKVVLESTIGIYGTGLLDAIPEEDLKAQYLKESKAGAKLNPLMWAGNDWAEKAWYTLADGKKGIKRFTYALTRASLQDGPGANAIWNILNVTRSDRKKLYTTDAWAKAMSENASVIAAIKEEGKDPASSLHPYYADGTDAGIANAVKVLLSPNTDQTDNDVFNFTPEMKDDDYRQLMIWHRGLAVPRARDLNNPVVQRGKELFTQMGCVHCHRPSWKTGSDNYWTSDNAKDLPKYPNQTIWPYTDMVQHQLHMANNIRTGWCRTTPLWGRGLSLLNTGAQDRLHDCRARNEVEAIMWHAYSKESDAYRAAEQFYNLSKEDRDAVVKFLRSI